MPPALYSAMSAPSTGSLSGEVSPLLEDPLVPILVVESGAPDPVAVATWHLALTSTTAVEVPHDLFAMWLFPASGGAVLLGPEALAEDKVAVPIPAPHLLQDQIFQLEEILRRAKYASAIAVPVRHASRDVGVMLLGSFTRGAFGPREALALQSLGRKLTATLGALGDVMSAVAPHSGLDASVSLETLPQHLAHVAAEVVNGQELVRRVSGVLYALLPHDRLEILAIGATEASLVPLSGTASRRRWTSSRSAADPFATIVARFGNIPTLLVDDLTELETESSWTFGSGDGSTHQARAVLGASLEVGGRRIGYLLLGSVAAAAFRPEDEDTVAMAALLVATRVSEMRLTAEVEARRADVVVAAAPASPLIHAARALATTAHLGEGLARFSEALREVLPHERITIHLRWGEDGVVALDPGAPRPFADLPTDSATTFHGALVLGDEVEWLVRTVDEQEELLVPLVVAGRAIGTLGVRAAAIAEPAEAAVIALEFANVLAPHLELLRRSASAVPPRSGAVVVK